jgi:REP element-mobilizing transposase RayT
MSEPAEPRRHNLPHNPDVRELVGHKRRWSSPLKPEHAKLGFQGWHERGYLPHRDEPGLTQLVTFRLKDSFPKSLQSEWAHLWEIEDDRERRKKLEAYLDKGRGECHLRRYDVAKLVEVTLRFFRSELYELRAWVVMPNHVHVLFKVGATPMSKIVGRWKSYTAKEINKILAQRGAFWGADYWDTYMRDSRQELRARLYIENNPTKAGLVRDPKEWPWSSARFRDVHGVLHL